MSNSKSSVITMDTYIARLHETTNYLTARKMVEGVLDWATIEEAAERFVLRGMPYVDFGTWLIWSGDVHNYLRMWNEWSA